MKYGMSMYRSKGYVLLTVLIFLQLFVLLGLYGLLSAKLSLRTTRDIYQQSATRLEMQQLLNEVELNLLAYPCKSRAISLFTLKQANLNWWQEHGCSTQKNGQELYFYIEDMDVDACAIIKSNQALTSQYYRITLAKFSGQQAIILLQSTSIRPVSPTTICLLQPHFVSLGRQMLRELK
jgi:hypothetical protein